MIRRRLVRYCPAPSCGEKLVQKPDEPLTKFLKCSTCSKECAEEMRTIGKKTAYSCFCGKPRSVENAPFCSWDHRLIAIKCKSWGFEPNIKQYMKHSEMLQKQQSEIDKACRPDPTQYLA